MPKNMPTINAIWNSLYRDVDVEKKERKKCVSFTSEKVNTEDVCNCNTLEALSCNLHDGSREINHKYFKLIQKYFANHLFFKEKEIIAHLDGKYDIISACLKSTIENIERLKKRKREIFEEDLGIYLLKPLQNTPRVVMMEDYDPDWDKFLAKWDNSLWDAASARKQQKFIKTSLIKGGARDLDGSLVYNNLQYMEKLVGLLENSQEIVFMDFLMV